MSDPQAPRIAAGPQTDNARSVIARERFQATQAAVLYPATPSDAGAALNRYTMMIEPVGHPEARRELVVKARDDGDAYDQAADHAAAELPYRCTIAIAKIEEIRR